MSNMLISQWHCIILITVIVLAVVFMRGKGSGSEKQSCGGGNEPKFRIRTDECAPFETI